MSKKGRLGISEKEVNLGRSKGKREEMTEEEAINAHHDIVKSFMKNRGEI